MAPEYLRDLFNSMEGNEVHQCIFVYVLCTRELQCLVSEMLVCRLGNLAGYMLQLVYKFLEQAPDVPSTVNEKVAAHTFIPQPYQPELSGNVKKAWEESKQEHRQAIIDKSKALLAVCNSKSKHFSKGLHKVFMDLKVDSVYFLQPLAGTLDKFFQEGEVMLFSLELQQMCLPVMSPAAKTSPYVKEIKMLGLGDTANWIQPESLVKELFPVQKIFQEQEVEGSKKPAQN